MATITSLGVVHRQGQTFLTFTKNAGSNGSTTYDVYRSESQITSLSGLTKIATLDADSWHLLYDDSAAGITKKLSSGFVVPGSSGEDVNIGGTVTLTSTQGLLVWTTAVTGPFYYAVVNSNDATVTVGTNSLASPVSETHQTTPGWVLIQDPINNTTCYVYKYFRWEDYSTWETAYWGYYGHRVNVGRPASGSNYRLYLSLHAAGAGYVEAPGTGSDDTFCAANDAAIWPRDLDMQGNTDPYATSDPTYDHSYHFGRYSPATDRVVPIDENRYVAYVKLIQANGTFSTDVNRVYVDGASLGSASMFVAAHHPDIFAAAKAQIGSSTFIRSGPPAGKFMTGTTITWENWTSMKWLADNNYRMPPITHQYNKDDGFNSPANYPAAITAFESAHLPFAAQWGTPNGAGSWGHASAELDSENPPGATLGSGHRWDIYRFKLNEAMPAFANVGTSSAVGTAPLTSSDPTFHGQRNLFMDWHSALHSITGGSAITDTASTFGVSIMSTSSNTTGDVTIRNAQTFLPGVGAIVTWSTDNGQSGTATRNSDGTVTATGVSIPTSAVRLTFAATGLSSPSDAAPPAGRARWFM